jgi:hypothetical protein
LSGFEDDRLMIDEKTGTDLGTLGIEHDSAGLVRSLLQSLSQVGNGATVGLTIRTV